MREMRNAYKILARKTEWKRPLIRSNHRWEDNIRLCLWEIWWKVVDWMHVVQNTDKWQALVNVIVNLWIL
jgi:hypothetical protein